MNLSTTNITDDGLDVNESQNKFIVGYVILLFISGIPALTNMSYTVVCFRIFSKEFQKLLILCLCLSGSILGFSTVWYSVLSIFRSALFNPLSCSFSMFLMSFGLCLSYSFLFILNLASYFTVRSYNYGIKHKLDHIKIPLFCGVFICSGLISCSTWVIPHSPVIKACNSVALFGDHYNIYVSLVMGPVGLLLLVTVITSILAVKQIYTMFSKKVLKSNQIGAHSIGNNKSERNITHQGNDERVFAFSSHISSCEGENNVAHELECETTNTLKRVCMINENNHTRVAMAGRKMRIKQKVGCIKQTQLAQQQSMSCDDGAPSTKHDKLKWKSWERKAFITNLVITIITVLLTGPFIGVMLVSIVVNGMPFKAGLFTFILFSLNNAISPFIYAWRIPEIRQQLKNICRQN